MEKKTCPKCGSGDYQFRSRKAIGADSGELYSVCYEPDTPVGVFLMTQNVNTGPSLCPPSSIS